MGAITELPWRRDEIENPRCDQADPDELREGFCSINDPVSNGSIGKNAKNNRDEEPKTDQVKKMDHFFLP